MSSLEAINSSRILRLVDQAKCVAEQSKMALRHGAVMFHQNSVITTSCNSTGDALCGYDVPSLHAEATCLKHIYNSRSCSFGSRCRQKQCFLQV